MMTDRVEERFSNSSSDQALSEKTFSLILDNNFEFVTGLEEHVSTTRITPRMRIENYTFTLYNAHAQSKTRSLFSYCATNTERVPLHSSLTLSKRNG